MANFRTKIKPVIEKNPGLRSIFSTTNKAILLQSLEPHNEGIYNTKLTVKIDQWVDGLITTVPAERYEDRVLFYSRDRLQTLIKPEIVANLTGTIEQILRQLNTLNFDFTIDDLEIVGDKLRAKLDSLGYVGEITLPGIDPPGDSLNLMSGESLELMSGGVLEMMGN